MLYLIWFTVLTLFAFLSAYRNKLSSMDHSPWVGISLFFNSLAIAISFKSVFGPLAISFSDFLPDSGSVLNEITVILICTLFGVFWLIHSLLVVETIQWFRSIRSKLNLRG